MVIIATINCTRTRPNIKCGLHISKGDIIACIKCSFSYVSMTQTGLDRKDNGLKKVFDGMDLNVFSDLPDESS